MQLPDAWVRLGIKPTRDARQVRRAYLIGVRAEHPDVSSARDANLRTSELSDAYKTILAALQAEPRRPLPKPRPAPDEEPIDVTTVDGDTIGIAAPANEAFPFLIEGCHEIGDVTFLDRRAGLIQVTVDFVDEPVCYLVLSMQGRASGITEVFCSIESIEQRPAPPIAAVTRLLVETLSSLVW